jgi:acyl-CoA reductase-like NAD-dependent aldehyde dehydrogenase
MPVWREETFGPVARWCLKDVEGIAATNDCQYGLGANVWTSGLDRGRLAGAKPGSSP